ncbi:glutamine amidotransferase-related protein [Nakamurella aerolata]|uniref:Type 1 glutamine amidotransferase n=1 Tax=Nakamurella aerolata TaxID=1656892 RepID=A0A849AA64_9ACTN|nr:type 1 glutamine amidotransferase [Nakamurella aerolata]
MTPEVLVVRNAASSGPGRLTEALTAAGLRVRVVDGERLIDPADPVTLDGAAGVVLLGGGLMPDDDAAAPWLPAERRMAEQAMAQGIPLLGICLGGQLLAFVAGGTVAANTGERERGSCRIDVLPGAAGDGLLGGFVGRPPLRMIQNHRDRITALPPDAVLLASNAACPIQAFRVGELAWGLQFHPEADAERVARWDADTMRADGFDPDQVIATARADAAVNQAQAHLLFDAFAAVVRDTVTAREAAVRDAAAARHD